MKTLISVEEAEKIIEGYQRNFGAEEVPINESLGRILAEDIIADRDFPPFDRVTMDGIAFHSTNYHGLSTKLNLQEVPAFAGDPQKTLLNPYSAIEVMTGAMLPLNTDSVIRYEDVKIQSGVVSPLQEWALNRNIHQKGSDRKQRSVIIPKGKNITAGDIAIAATVGKAGGAACHSTLGIKRHIVLKASAHHGVIGINVGVGDAVHQFKRNAFYYGVR